MRALAVRRRVRGARDRDETVQAQVQSVEAREAAPRLGRAGGAAAAGHGALAPAPMDARLMPKKARNSVPLSEHASENACPRLDPGWEPVFRKDHAQTRS